MDFPLQNLPLVSAQLWRRGDRGRIRVFVFTSGTSKEEVNHINREEKTFLIPLNVDACKIIAKIRGGGLFVEGVRV